MNKHLTPEQWLNVLAYAIDVEILHSVFAPLHENSAVENFSERSL